TFRVGGLEARPIGQYFAGSREKVTRGCRFARAGAAARPDAEHARGVRPSPVFHEHQARERVQLASVSRPATGTARQGDQPAGRSPRPRLLAGRDSDDALEATPEHALAVEGHLRRVHRVLELRIVHHRLADAVAIRLVAIDDPGQRDHLVVLELYGLGERCDLAGLSVVAD